jgi:hypothetical protein
MIGELSLESILVASIIELKRWYATEMNIYSSFHLEIYAISIPLDSLRSVSSVWIIADRLIFSS